MDKTNRFVIGSLLSLSCASVTALGVVNPFTETFPSAGANWSSAATFTALNYPASGGPDGSAYGSTGVSFANNLAGDQPIIFRGQSNFNSSGNAFVGNWITSGVTQLSFSVRHNLEGSVGFFVRFAPAAGPGAVAVIPSAALPGGWRTFSVDINPSTPFIYEGTNFNVAFGDVARVQVGVLVDQALAGQPGPFTFDIDNVAITPAPGSLALMGLGAFVALRRRR